MDNEKIKNYQLFIAKIYSTKQFEQYYRILVEHIRDIFGEPIHNKLKIEIYKEIEEKISNSQEKHIKEMHKIIKENPLSGVDDDEKVIISLILAIINNFFYEDVIKNTKKYDFVFDYPVDIIFMVSISDFTPLIFSFMDMSQVDHLMHREELKDFLKMNVYQDEFDTQLTEFFSYLKENNNDEGINQFRKDFLVPLIDYMPDHIKCLEHQFLNQILLQLKYRDLIDFAYTSNPDEDNFLLNTCFISRFIEDDSYRSIGIHDMLEFSNQIYDDYKSSTFNLNSNESKFFENAFFKLSEYFDQITKHEYSPFLSSAIFEIVNKLKKSIPKGVTRSNFKNSMETIIKKTNDIEMASDRQNKSLPYYFLDLSGTPLHKLMELNPKTIIPFTLSPYLLTKELPNIEVLRQTPEKSKKCQPDFDSKIFSCSPTADSTIAVIRDIFVEYDGISERLINREFDNSNIMKEKQTSPLPGMLIFKLSMLQWDFLPNFALDMDFVPVFQVPYNSINKLALNPLPDTNPKSYFLDLHTADCNLCFYPLTETESKSIRHFFKDQIRIEEYQIEKLRQHFLEKSKSEMTQAACNYIPNLIEENKNKHFEDNDKSIESRIHRLYKEFSNIGKKENLETEIPATVKLLCGNNAPIIILETVCYFCQEDPQFALKVIECIENELKTADKQKKRQILTIIDRFIDPAILQNAPALIDKAKKLIESIQLLFGEDKNDIIIPGELTKKVVSISKGSHFFALTSEGRKNRLGFDIVHREWLMKSIHDEDDDD